MSETDPSIVLTSGEPAGIGPDLCCALAGEPLSARLAVIGDPELMRSRASMLGARLRIVSRAAMSEVQPHTPGTLQLLPVATRAAVIPGRLDTANAEYVLETLAAGVDLCLARDAQALVTGPVQKSVINEAGRPFSGHTEFLAERTGAPLAVMLLTSRQLRVALATTHLPLRDVAAALTAARLEQVLRILDTDLRSKFSLAKPRILVLGLNPHAGERGALGSEERSTIEPVLEKLRAEKLELIGPVPADTAFTAQSLARADAVLAMYHDQGLPVLKATGFGEIVNVTLGLPIVRTSVDHGTALEIAGSGRARHDSLRAAALLAIELAGRSP